MTGDGMNASRSRFAVASRGLAAVALSGALAGCAAYDPFNQEIDPNSPAAQRVEALARADDAYPRWEDFPAEPQAVPTAADIRNRVEGLQAEEVRLNRQVAAIDWTLDADDREPWAARTLNRIDPRLSRPVDPNEMAEALAWARRMRERADPPPPITH